MISGCNNPKGGSVIQQGNAPFLQKPAAFSFSEIKAQNGTVDIAWIEARRVANYSFFMGTSPGAISTPVPECSGLVESCQLTGLDPNTTYYFNILANNDAGSTSVSSIGRALSVGLFNITSSSAGDQTITLSWASANNATSYNVIFGTSSGSYTQTRTNVTSPYVLTGLTNGVQYYVRVLGVNADNGYSSSNNEINGQPYGPLPAPTGLTLTASSNQIYLDWNDSSGATQYKIFKGTTPGALTQIGGGPYTASNFTDTGLTNGQPYYYQIVASNGFDSPRSVEVGAQPIASFNMTGASPSPGPSQVTVSWATPVAGATGYDIQYGTNPASLSSVISSATSPYVFNGLTPNLPYYFRIVAKNGIGAGTTILSTNQLSATPLQPLAVPTGLVATANPGQIILDWADVPGATEYKIYRGTTSGALSLVAGGPYTGSNFTDNTVSNGQPYFYAVRASNGSFDSNLTSEVSKKPISSFTLSSATVATFSSANITWTAAAGADAYDIRYGTTSGDYTVTSANRTSSATLTGLSGATTYFVVITARNAVGTLTLVTSNELSFTTGATFPTVAIDTYPLINNSNKAAYTVDGTCSENGRIVTVTIGAVTATTTCTALAWSTIMDVTSVPDSASRTITAVHTNSGGNNDTETRTVIKDTTNPTVAITNYPSINNANNASYTVSGTCSENSRTVSVSIGGIGATPACNSLLWTTTVNASALSDGSVTITADHTDAAGNSATQATRSVVKDVSIPSVAISSSPVINNTNKNAYTLSGTCSETGGSVVVNVGATSSTVSCLLLNWTATLNVSTNGDSPVLLITANHSDAAGNSATQASTLVVKDTVDPVVTITSANLINNANKSAYTVSGACSENTRIVSVDVGGVTSTPTCTSSAWTATLDVTAIADSGSVSVTASQTDTALNSGLASTTVVKNTSLPTVAITSSPMINNSNRTAYPISGTCSENTRAVSVNVGGVNASPTCTTGAWSAVLNVTAVGDNASISITANHIDAVGNSAIQASTTVLKDTIIPTVAITSSPTINNGNRAAYSVSGTCSENTRNVVVSVAAVSSTVTCNALAWSAVLNVTAVVDSATVAVSATHSDTAGNSATPGNATVIKDTTNPTVSISVSPIINNVNDNAYTLSGTCSENTRQVSVSVGGLTSTPTCNTGAWSATINVSGLADNNSIPITADHTDAAGNNATQSSTTVVKDTANPTVAITSSPIINNTNKASYTVSGTCSENTRTVSVNVGGVTSTPTCTASAWSAILNVTAIGDSASVSITANHSDASGNSATQSSTTVLKDTVIPTVTISSAPDINGANAAAYPISGTCSENTRTVSVNVGGVTSTPTCTTGAWSASMNVTGISDGTGISVTANHSDSAGNNAIAATDSVNKLTLLPTVSINTPVAINMTNRAAYSISGACSVNSRPVTVNVGGVSASPTCTTGAWSVTLDLTAVGDNSSVSATADHSDSFGNNAIQASTTILKDTVIPTVTITSSPIISNGNRLAYTVSGACSENTRNISVNIGSASGSGTCTALTWSASLDVTAVPDSGSVSITANHTDLAGNSATQASASVLKDTSNPTVTITASPVINNANVTSYTVSGTCSEDTRTVSLNVGGISASPTCTTSAWSATLNVTGVADSGSVSITANHSDAAGNSATQASTSVIKDTSLPTVAITSSGAINDGNKASYAVTGTCSENTRTITVNVGGVTTIPTCSGLSWSTSVNATAVGDNTSVTITANHSDASGNAANQASVSVLKDTVIPLVAITSSPAIISSNQSAYVVSGTCSENTRTVSVNVGGVTASPACSTGAWSATLNASAIPDSDSVSITANHSDLAGNAATQASTTVIKDANLPTVAISSSPTINNANRTAYTVTGTCSENSRIVSVNIGGVTATPTCSAGSWSTGAINVTTVSDSGTVSITANHTDVNGNNAIQASTTVLKDTSNPTVAINASSNINNFNRTAYTVTGTCSENGRPVAVSIGGVATSPTCSGGTWTTGAVNVTAAMDSATLSITANHADAAANSATQASTTVVKDTSNPTVSITSSPVINNANRTAYTVSGTCSDTGRTVTINVGSVSTSDTCTLLTWTATVDVSGNPDSLTLLITADHTDASGNTAVQAGTTVVKDTANPTVAITSSPVINNANRTAYTVSGTCSENTRIVTISIGGVAASPTCSAGAWTTGAINVTAAADSATLSITANHTDSAGNSATQASASVVKDTSNPTVAITSSPGISLGNSASYTVSGTCSENSRTVTVSVGGVIGTPTCMTNTWSSTLNVTAVSDSASLSVTANHSDANGNNAPQASTTVNKDTVVPTVALSSTAPASTSINPLVVRATFSEAVTGVAIGDFVISNGSASNFNAISTTVYEIDVTPAGAGIVTVDIGASVAVDAAGNNNTAATQLTRTFLPPAVLAFADTSTHDYGTVNVGSTADLSILVTKSGSANATSISEVGLAAPFAFKGGSYPGTGGTCGATISANCTIVVTFTPTANGVRSDTIQINYNDGAVTRSITKGLTGTGLAIVATHTRVDGPAGVMINQCVAYTVNSTTLNGTNANVSANQTVNLVVNNGTGTFFSNNTCGTTITSTIIASGTSATTIYFRSTTANQNLTLVFNPTSLVSTSLNVGTTTTPTRIWFVTPPEMETSRCYPLAIDLTDANGTKAGRNVSVTVNLTDGGAAQYYSDVNCTGVITSVVFPANTESRTVYVMNPTQQSITLTGTDSAAVLTARTTTVSFVNTLVWWNTAYEKRIPLTISNLDQATAHTNIPVLVKLDATRISYADIQSAGQDIRFTLSDHTTTLNYDIERWNSAGDSFIWVRLPSIAASSTAVIYMYYKNSIASNGETPSTTWSGYSGVWNLDKSGANYPDSTGSGKTGVPQGVVTDITGVIGNAISLNGSSALDVSYDLSQVIGRTSTFSAWLKTNQVGSNTAWMAPGITGVEQSGGGNDIFFGWISGSGTIRVSTGNGAVTQSNFVVNDNNWRYVTMSRDEASGAVRFYVNGVLNGSGSSETGHKSTPFSQFGVIGDTGGSPVYLNGSLDGIRLINSVQTDARIRAEYKYSTQSHISFGTSEDL